MLFCQKILILISFIKISFLFNLYWSSFIKHILWGFLGIKWKKHKYPSQKSSKIPVYSISPYLCTITVCLVNISLGYKMYHIFRVGVLCVEFGPSPHYLHSTLLVDGADVLQKHWRENVRTTQGSCQPIWIW